MTKKQRLIVEFLSVNGGEGYYIDIRENVGHAFDNENDFDRAIRDLVNLKLINERDNDTYYTLNSPKSN